MASVTHITSRAHQPRGGYINLERFDEHAFEDGLPFHGEYSIVPGTLGTTVDYLSRALLGFSVKKAFEIAIMGAHIIGAKETGYANDLANQLQDAIDSGELTDNDIRNAVRLARYDAAYRAGAKSHNPNEGAEVDEKTVSDIRTLVRRTVSFFEENGPVVDAGITFEGGYGDVLDSGDADLLTEDTLWDLKTSKDKPSPADTLQLAVYYLLSLRSSKEEFKPIRKLGFYNPRLNKSWTIDVLDLDEDVLDQIQTDILGFEKHKAQRVNWSKEPSQTIYYVIDWIRDTAESESDKGTKFERASRYYLKNDPLYSARFTDVWMWKDAPTNNGHDIGIDLVAQDAEDGSYWAIQCKCYDEESTLDYKTVSTFFGAQGNNDTYAHNMLISTTENLTPNLDKVLTDWSTVRLFPSEMDQAEIDWQPFIEGKEIAERSVYDPLPHQERAIEDCIRGFSISDRGKLIMACGTGKTLTSLRLTEKLVGKGGFILFLAPSISLVGQSMRAWINQSKLPMRVAVVCSDEKASSVEGDTWDTSLKDLPYPATTNPDLLFAQMNRKIASDGLTVVFSTYQSIQVVSDAQAMGLPEFDLVICDEAHRTTGAKEASAAKEDISQYVKVHDNSIIIAKKRLYMTATPRIYGDNIKKVAKADDYVVASMDDETVYGPEFHRLTFGQAVDEQLLTDYKVIALTVSESMVDAVYQMAMAGDTGFEIPDAAKIIGCWKGLLDQGRKEGGTRLKNAVAFCSTIRESQRIEKFFTRTVASYINYEREEKGVDLPEFYCDIQHVDGSMNAKDRKDKLAWLADVDEERCRILSNARCLAEGIDVPNLDAVLFLQPKKSQIDIIQAVGRVMRKFEGKEYGYIILPIVVPAGMTAVEALDESEPYAVVWQVLKALRSHDERLDATINALPYDKDGTGKDVVDIIDLAQQIAEEEAKAKHEQLKIYFSEQELQEAVNAMIVRKCGTKVYWEEWAKDIAQIAKRHISRIEELVSIGGIAREPFERFLKGLRDSLNDGITEPEAVDMLAQHIITLPVFEALFRGAQFADSNPVSIAMEKMIDALREYTLETEDEKRELAELYRSVEIRAESIHTDSGRQRIIKELYEKFFSQAFTKTSEKMGIVYTPNQIVDFILRSTNALLHHEFGQTFADEGVHILDPFTGTGTFIVNLLNDDALMPSDKIEYKYANELHCNEIMLLAYYIATINIEHAYHSRIEGDYIPFPGAVLTDTFQMTEEGDPLDLEVFTQNSKRVVEQNRLPVRVIIGNPPYSIGQKNANDNNQNMKYKTLDGRISDTYAKQSEAGLVKSLYDPYIRAFRWSGDRIGDRGIICFVTNSGWLDTRSMDGFRKAMEAEYSTVYIYNLRGNQKSVNWKAEGGKVFGSGSQAGIAITMLVKNPDHKGPAVIKYHEVADGMSAEEKLEELSIATFNPDDEGFWTVIKPNELGDWINQRDISYASFIPIYSDDGRGLFSRITNGVVTNRDAWAYNYSKEKVAANMARLIEAYNDETDRYHKAGAPSDIRSFVDSDPAHIKWTRGLLGKAKRGNRLRFNKKHIVSSEYRPFSKRWLYYSRDLNEVPGQQDTYFGMTRKRNLAIGFNSPGSTESFAFIVDRVANSSFGGSEGSQWVPLKWFEKQEPLGGLFGNDEGGIIEHDGITDWALEKFRAAYGDITISKDDIFYYVYGILNSPEYKERFGNDLKKQIPRIPLSKHFKAFSSAGRKLVELHTGYEKIEPYPLKTNVPIVSGNSEVRQMKFGKRAGEKDMTRIVVNDKVVISDIPLKAYEYRIKGRSAIEWIVKEYAVQSDVKGKSGIENNPNDYSDDPMYIIDLLKKVVRVSMETLETLSTLPPIDEMEEADK
ncbi:Hef nuclease [Slackia heliotrinireducens]|uniref:Predicted helicase n=1 Tax=Slackia heliotrinireducens (strain ATCC 29202 / DSM 20476 / NCTC 11029 / RHS 1) TaxID=471855 RepID=C7N696_SLAHD|nr:type ISP restriction/modification enzyme [Slackia heliotrinireducens]ACV22431.1 predicted helicase [Slackia heliotrinireducens DSM 20476]VEH00775.1 Hef nuclease [Slackia heliotrinireducens]